MNRERNAAALRNAQEIADGRLKNVDRSSGQDIGASIKTFCCSIHLNEQLLQIRAILIRLRVFQIHSIYIQ